MPSGRRAGGDHAVGGRLPVVGMLAVRFGPGAAGWSAAPRVAVCPRRVRLLVFVPSVADLPRARRRADEANALSNSPMGIGLFFRPSIGVTMVGAGSASVVWRALGVLVVTEQCQVGGTGMSSGRFGMGQDRVRALRIRLAGRLARSRS